MTQTTMSTLEWNTVSHNIDIFEYMWYDKNGLCQHMLYIKRPTKGFLKGKWTRKSCHLYIKLVASGTSGYIKASEKHCHCHWYVSSLDLNSFWGAMTDLVFVFMSISRNLPHLASISKNSIDVFWKILRKMSRMCRCF